MDVTFVTREKQCLFYFVIFLTFCKSISSEENVRDRAETPDTGGFL
jgi:hypothetical protein